MHRRNIVVGLLFLLGLSLYGQKGGESTYSFLGLVNSGRVAALGGELVSVADDDINLIYHNPALLGEGMDRHMTLNYVNHFAGVNVGYAAYARSFEGIGSFAGGIHYINYGTFDGRDELANPTGSFRAAEYALNLSYSRVLVDTFLSVAANLKPIISTLESYSSLGLALDIGLIYHNPESRTSAGLVLKNMGMQLTTYAGEREKLPFEIQAGFTQGLAHAPFRFSLTLQHLERWDLSYELEDDGSDTGFGTVSEKSKMAVFGDQLMRHVVIGTEILLGENFHVDFGYNYKRRQELKIEENPGMVGFSWGFGFRVSKFHIAFGRSSYHMAGGTSHFSLTTNLSEFYRKQ